MERKNEVEVISPIEQAARACVAEYNTWWMYNYLELDLLVKLLQSRRVGMARDISFENKILWALIHSNENYREVKADQSTHNELSRLFLLKYNRGDQDLHDFKKGESAKFPGALRGLLMSLAGHLEAHINYPCLRQMELDTTSHMLPFLTTQEQVSLFSTCRALKEKAYGIMPIHKLLYLVSRGRQAEAEEMIRANPESLQQKGDITDGAGRYFKQITALQYAVWALDAHMWTMMLPLFPDAFHINPDNYWFSAAAAEQVRALEEKGTAHGRHFDFKPLLDAYAAYMASPMSGETWCRGVGGAQWFLPDHVIQEITMPGRPFHPVPDFSVQRGRPGVHGERGVTWWRTARWSGGVMGTSWAAWRDDDVVHATRRSADPFLWVLLGQAASVRDQTAINALWTQRERDLSALLTTLNIMPSQPPECKLPGRRRDHDVM